jgi:hypothetical protein
MLSFYNSAEKPRYAAVVELAPIIPPKPTVVVDCVKITSDVNGFVWSKEGTALHVRNEPPLSHL